MGPPPVNGPRLFGTDGIRGRVGDSPLIPEELSALGRAVGNVLASGRSPGGAAPRALLGHVGRRSGPELLNALARGLRESGHVPESAGLITTPAIALLARLESFDVALMVSASHNPACDNGIKIFQASGEKLPDEVEDEIQRQFEAQPEPAPDSASPAHNLQLEKAYLGHIVELAGDLDLSGLSIVLDCANGGASRIAPRALGRLGARVTTIAAEPDGDNINQGCGATDLALLQHELIRSGADIGIAMDGDGDRCMLVDSEGDIVHGDGILTLCARHAMEAGQLPDPRVVATVMSNRGLHRALREKGITVVTTDVGDRRVVECLRREEILLGGEQSGHIVFGPDHHYIGDGLYTALRVLRVMQSTGSPLKELAAPYQPFPQVLLNVQIGSKPNFSEVPELLAMVEKAERELGDDGRVLLRYSGTEDLLRVMVEGPDQDWIHAQAHKLAEVISGAIGRVNS